MKKWLLARCLEISMLVEILRKFLKYFSKRGVFRKKNSSFVAVVCGLVDYQP